MGYQWFASYFSYSSLVFPPMIKSLGLWSSIVIQLSSWYSFSRFNQLRFESFHQQILNLSKPTCSFSLKILYDLRYKAAVCGVITKDHIRHLFGFSIEVLDKVRLNIKEVNSVGDWRLKRGSRRQKWGWKGNLLYLLSML